LLQLAVAEVQVVQGRVRNNGTVLTSHIQLLEALMVYLVVDVATAMVAEPVQVVADGKVVQQVY
jgi:hypothetical protein